jgi:2-(1,2-epoxy-1,2-dihydrophenyl)acetyl-CoA isomerase
MGFTTIEWQVNRGVGRLTLNRPQPLNAMTLEMIGEIIAALDSARDDAAVRAVMITGNGRGFCAGADLRDFEERFNDTSGQRDLGAAMDRLFNPMMRRIRDLPKPVLCAVNGVAGGGGANLALAGDIVVAARSARFTQAFVNISLLPDLGGTWFLPRVLGDQNARALSMLADSVSAEQALARGMVWEVYDDAEFAGRAFALAQRLAEGPSLAYAAIKQALNTAATASLDSQLDLERDLQRKLGRTADHAEGVAAFRAKRPAQFTGA